jgi:hypothetical protein
LLVGGRLIVSAHKSSGDLAPGNIVGANFYDKALLI